MKAQKKHDDEEPEIRRFGRIRMEEEDENAGDEFQSVEFLDKDELEILDHSTPPGENWRNESDEENNSYYFQSAPSTSPKYRPIFQHSPNLPIGDTFLDDQSSTSSMPSSASSSSVVINDNKRDFNISPLMPNTINDPDSKIHKPSLSAQAQLKCPACLEPIRIYYCAKCIQIGKFIALNSEGKFQHTDIIEEYKKQDSLMSGEKQQTQSFNHNDNDEKIILENTLQFKYRNLVKKTEALKNLFQCKQVKLKQTLNILEESRTQLDRDRKSNKSTLGKIELIKKIIISRKGSIEKRHTAEATLSEDLKQYINRRAFQLTNDIFPLEEINLFEKSNSFVNMETSPLLTFSDGSHHQIEQQTAFSIVEPWLPSDGDYSSYGLWVNDNREHLAEIISDSSERNPAFRIGAALAYTTQLTQNLAFYLDMILPTRMDLKVFNRELLDDTQFSYNVAKLNSNIIHLCISQGVDIALLQPLRTLKNLMLLFNINIGELGKKPIIEVDNEEAAVKIEEKLSLDLGLVQDSFYDFSKFAADDENSDSEWEISDSINTPEMQMATEQSIQQNSYISRLPLRLLSSFWGTGN